MRRTNTESAIVGRVDHVYARVADPRSVFATLTEVLGLPRTYGFARVPGLEGGAVTLGNIVFLEVLRYAPGRRVRAPATPGLNGLALETALPIEDAAKELTARELAHGPPSSYVGDPSVFSFGPALERAGLRRDRGPIWSLVPLGGLLGEDTLPKLFKLIPTHGRSGRGLGRIQGRVMGSRLLGDAFMAATVTPHPAVWVHAFDAADMAVANEAAAAELRSVGGGALGIERVREVVLGARDVVSERARWKRLLAPAQPDPTGLWGLGDGPGLRLVESDRDCITYLVCEVTALDQARQFLADHRMLEERADDEVRISPAALQGIAIRLVQA